MKNKLILLGISLSLFAGCTPPPPVVENVPTFRFVEVDTISRESIANTASYSGRVAPSKQVGVVPSIPGKVIGYNFEIGDSVSEGEVLFTVDSSDLHNNMRSLQANYDAAKLGYDNAETTYNSNKLLFDEGIISQADIDQIFYAFESAGANLGTMEVQMEILQKSIDDCSVISPLSGIIATRDIEQGGFATQSSPAYVVMNLSTVKITIGVSEEVVNTISAGKKVSVLLNAVSPTPFTGTVRTVSPTVDQTGTYAIGIEVNNGNNKIKSGMLAEVSFVKESATNTIVLPRDAVITKDEGSHIFLIEENIAIMTPVTTGIETGETIEITTPLPDGGQVVTKGQTYLSDGEEIRIIDPDGEASELPLVDPLLPSPDAPKLQEEE